ncbi:hypothetical protein DXB54_04440 [Coprococcus sp. OM04-5BH]|nr:hypothetical protein DXB54_04440 [Coprococcus sp. OM04-5BH]
MCKSMNALFSSFHGQRTRKQLLDKLSRSSNKKEGGYQMYSKNSSYSYYRWILHTKQCMK